jgi:hypothetical protein
MDVTRELILTDSRYPARVRHHVTALQILAQVGRQHP